MNPLVSTIQKLSTELAPIPTDTETKLPKLSGIRSVLFDVYGTLMVSGVGDISHSSNDHRKSGIIEVVQNHGIHLLPNLKDPGSALKSIILKHQERERMKGIQHPEVDIREVWFDFLKDHSTLKTIQDPCDALIEDLCIQYELKVNPTWPMPSLASTLQSLRDAGVLLGIVSNAQFFTPLLFDAYLGTTLEKLGFSDKLCQWSYSHKEAKPSEHLYQLNADLLKKQHNICPEQVIYVGNDMLNDITPARAVGFKTALFAGDKRSLRLRESDARIQGVIPDLVVTSLDQVIGCILE